jgi:hypothetical protein
VRESRSKANAGTGERRVTSARQLRTRQSDQDKKSILRHAGVT